MDPAHRALTSSEDASESTLDLKFGVGCFPYLLWLSGAG